MNWQCIQRTQILLHLEKRKQTYLWHLQEKLQSWEREVGDENN